MPRLRLVVGMNVAGESREAGSLVDVPGDVAKYLLDMGRAELVRGGQPETPEGSAPTPERTNRKRRRQEVETR
jgi:hypothetical protein